MIEIVQLNQSHITALVEMEQQCAAIPWSQGMFEAELESKLAHYFVALDNGVPVAYAGMWVVLFEGQIINILVSPSHRRRGIGERFMQCFEDVAQSYGLTELTLEVRVSNAPAISLYQKHGFKNVGIRKAYYEDNKEDAYLMTKQIVYFE